MDRKCLEYKTATATATAAGRAAVVGLLKFIPGIGTFIGGAINATIAGGFTMAMGTAWALVCEQLAKGGLRTVDGVLDADAIRDVFMSTFKDQVTKRLKK